MGYAKLWFDNAGANTITHVMHDIVGVITGTYTSTSQLTVADKTLSEIVNTQNSNWDFLYPAAHGVKGNTNTSWVLTAPCQSSNTKLKYIRISSQIANGGAGQAGGSALFQTSTAGGVKLTCATGATSNTVLSNETYYQTATTATVNDLFHQFTGNFITLSWSQRHLIMFGTASANTTQRAFTGCIETTETPISIFRNVAPFVFFHRCHYWTNTTTQAALVTITHPTYTVPIAVQNYKYDVFIQLNHYNPSTTVTSGLYNIRNSTSWGGVNNQQEEMPLLAESDTSTSVPTTFTKSSTGQNAIYMQPLFYHQHHIGIPHMYISSLADVYRVENDIGNTFDTFTVGANTYVYLVGDTTNVFLNTAGGTYSQLPSGFALAVRKA
jgi:hypothetical protein